MLTVMTCLHQHNNETKPNRYLGGLAKMGEYKTIINVFCFISNDVLLVYKIQKRFLFSHPQVFFMQGPQGSSGPKGDKVSFFEWCFINSPEVKPNPCDTYDKMCVAGREGHRTGRSSWSGWASRFESE